jgi:transcriptional regulator with XRE-family HTH domain
MSNDDLPGRVRAERKRRRLTQEEVAKRAGVSPRAYQMFETRKSVPQAENLRAILAALDIDPGDETARATRSSWPRDVQVFLDVMGVYLVTLSDEERMATIHDVTRQIFESRAS